MEDKSEIPDGYETCAGCGVVKPYTDMIELETGDEWTCRYCYETYIANL